MEGHSLHSTTNNRVRRLAVVGLLGLAAVATTVDAFAPRASKDSRELHDREVESVFFIARKGWRAAQADVRDVPPADCAHGPQLRCRAHAEAGTK